MSGVEHTDVGAYTLGLLDAADTAAFEDHLRGCERCRAELAELRGTAGGLRTVRALPEPSRSRDDPAQAG